MFGNAYYLPMDRVSILRSLIEGAYGGNQADFARAIKRSPAQINQWLQGVRAIGDAAARHIENTLNLGGRYFDGATPLASQTAIPSLTHDEQALIALYRGLTQRQKGDAINNLEAQKQANDAILQELTRQRA